MQGSYDTNIAIQDSNNYEDNPVAAFSVDAPPNGGSSGYYEQGVRINWEVPGGITGIGWYTENVNSPFWGASETAIEEHALAHGNLNIYFNAWGAREDIHRDVFIKQTIDSACWTFL